MGFNSGFKGLIVLIAIMFIEVSREIFNDS